MGDEGHGRGVRGGRVDASSGPKAVLEQPAHASADELRQARRGEGNGENENEGKCMY